MTLKMLLNFQTRALNPLYPFFPLFKPSIGNLKEGCNSLSCYQSLQQGREQPWLAEILEGFLQGQHPQREGRGGHIDFFYPN